MAELSFMCHATFIKKKKWMQEIPINTLLQSWEGSIWQGAENISCIALASYYCWSSSGRKWAALAASSERKWPWQHLLEESDYGSIFWKKVTMAASSGRKWAVVEIASLNIGWQMPFHTDHPVLESGGPALPSIPSPLMLMLQSSS